MANEDQFYLTDIMDAKLPTIKTVSPYDWNALAGRLAVHRGTGGWFVVDGMDMIEIQSLGQSFIRVNAVEPLSLTRVGKTLAAGGSTAAYLRPLDAEEIQAGFREIVNILNEKRNYKRQSHAHHMRSHKNDLELIAAQGNPYVVAGILNELGANLRRGAVVDYSLLFQKLSYVMAYWINAAYTVSIKEAYAKISGSLVPQLTIDELSQPYYNKKAGTGLEAAEAQDTKAEVKAKPLVLNFTPKPVPVRKTSTKADSINVLARESGAKMTAADTAWVLSRLAEKDMPLMFLMQEKLPRVQAILCGIALMPENLRPQERDIIRALRIEDKISLRLKDAEAQVKAFAKQLSTPHRAGKKPRKETKESEAKIERAKSAFNRAKSNLSPGSKKTQTSKSKSDYVPQAFKPSGDVIDFDIFKIETDPARPRQKHRIVGTDVYITPGHVALLQVLYRSQDFLTYRSITDGKHAAEGVPTSNPAALYKDLYNTLDKALKQLGGQHQVPLVFIPRVGILFETSAQKRAAVIKRYAKPGQAPALKL